MTVVLTQDNFNDSIASGLVLVDFWAEWCGPCQGMLPILDTLSEKMGDSMTVAKVNVDENQDIAMQYRVMSIPTLLLFKEGELVEQVVGAQTLDQLEELIAKHK